MFVRWRDRDTPVALFMAIHRLGHYFFRRRFHGFLNGFIDCLIRPGMERVLLLDLDWCRYEL